MTSFIEVASSSHNKLFLSGIKLFIKDQKQNKKICDDENIQFNFIGTKIKIYYIYKDEKLI